MVRILVEIVLLCGGRDSGKSGTLDELFRESTVKKVPFIELNGKKICICGGKKSVQEVNEFCQYDRVIEEIKRRVALCIKKYGGNIIIIIPFTVEVGGRKMSTKGKINRDCILEPLKWLKTNYKTYVVYLSGGRRTNDISLIETLMQEIKYGIKIESRDKPIEQAKELSDFIIRNIQAG